MDPRKSMQVNINSVGELLVKLHSVNESILEALFKSVMLINLPEALL